MDKFVKLTVPIMRHQIGLLSPVAAAADPTLDEIAWDIWMVAGVAAAVSLCRTNNDSRAQVAAMAPNIRRQLRLCRFVGPKMIAVPK